MCFDSRKKFGRQEDKFANQDQNIEMKATVMTEVNCANVSTLKTKEDFLVTFQRNCIQTVMGTGLSNRTSTVTCSKIWFDPAFYG